MSYSDSPAIIKAVIKAEWLLSEDFAALCDEIAADWIASGLPGVVIPPPVVVYTHERVVIPEAFPAAELLGMQSAPQGDSSAQQYEHAIDVLWTHAGDDEETLVRQIEGLVLATRKLTFRKVLELPSGVAAPLIPGVENYMPLNRRDRGMAQPLVKAATIRLRVPTIA